MAVKAALAAGMSVTAKVPLGLGKTRLKKSRVAADVCHDCGVIRFCATDLATLREASDARAVAKGNGS